MLHVPKGLSKVSVAWDPPIRTSFRQHRHKSEEQSTQPFCRPSLPVRTIGHKEPVHKIRALYTPPFTIYQTAQVPEMNIPSSDIVSRRTTPPPNLSNSQQSLLLLLPSELIDCIISFLCPRRDFEADFRIAITPFEQTRERHNKYMRATLRNLCLVSKAMHRHAEPALYSWVMVRDDMKRDRKQLCAFIAKFGSKPQLAQRMRYVEFFYDEEPPRRSREGDVSPEALESAVVRLMDGNRGAFEKWRPENEEDINTALVALILGRSLSLQHLSMSVSQSWSRNTHHVLENFDIDPIDGPRFPQLRVMCVTFVDPQLGLSLGADLMHLAQTLPRLNYLKLRFVGKCLIEPNEPESNGPTTYKFPSLQTLRIEGFGDSPDVLANIVEGCEGLRRLSCFSTAFAWAYEDPIFPADLSAMDRALQKHRASLETLTFCLDNVRHRGAIVPLTALPTLTNLRTLAVDTVSLLGAPWPGGATEAASRWWYTNTPYFRLSERLPPNIVELSLYNYHYFEDGVLVLRDLAVDCEFRLPNLKTVRNTSLDPSSAYSLWHCVTDLCIDLYRCIFIM